MKKIEKYQPTSSKDLGSFNKGDETSFYSKSESSQDSEYDILPIKR